MAWERVRNEGRGSLRDLREGTSLLPLQLKTSFGFACDELLAIYDFSFSFCLSNQFPFVARMLGRVLWLLFLIVERRFLGREDINSCIRFLKIRERGEIEIFLVDFLRFPLAVFVQSLTGNFHVSSAIQPRLLTRYSIGRKQIFPSIPSAKFNHRGEKKKSVSTRLSTFPGSSHFRFPEGWSLGRLLASVGNKVLFAGFS